MNTHLPFLRALFLVPLVWMTSFTLNAQVTQFSPGYTWRQYLNPTTCPNRLCHYYPMNGTSFTNNYEHKFQEFAAWRNSYAGGMPNAEVASSFLNFRVAFPLNYDPEREEPYPIIMFLHGGGEAGRIGNCCGVNWGTNDQRIDNSSHQLLHGGAAHADAIERDPSHPRAFPGILVYPQASYGASWYDSSPSLDTLHLNQKYLTEIIAYMAQNYNGDLNRVYLHGLSLGAKGVWDTATKRPDLFAAILPMSGVSPIRPSSVEVLQTTPIWQFQGGTDGNPTPQASQGLMNDLWNIGANPIYTVYPSLGHGTWNTAYAEPNFFSWMLAQDKRKIYVYGDKVWGGTVELCAGGGNTKKLGFSAGFTEYQWRKDGAIIPGANTRFYTVIGTGDYTGQYTVDFKRPGDNTWHSSFPVTITPADGSSYVPELTVKGSLIRPFTSDNNLSNISINTAAETHLVAPEGYPQYQWYRNSSLIATNTLNDVIVTHGAGTGNPANLNFNNQGNQANSGNWQVSVLLPSGCWSDLSEVKALLYPGYSTHSAPITTQGFTSTGDDRINITNGASSGNSSRPLATPLSESEIKITWGQNGTDIVVGETHFEIWRQRRTNGGYPFDDGPHSNGGFVMVGTAPENATEFISSGLRPGAWYDYLVRPVTATDGRFSRKSWNPTAPDQPNNHPTITLEDTKAPTPPSNLVVTDIQSTSISVSWSPATDNDVVNSYEVYNGATLVASISAVSYHTEKHLWNNATNYVVDDTVINSVGAYPNSLFVAIANNINIQPGTGSWTGNWRIIDRDLTNDIPPVTTYTFTNLEPGITYILNVRAKDFRNNRSPFAQAVVATTTGADNGLNFRYYETTGLSGNNGTSGNSTARQLEEPYNPNNGPNFNFSTATPQQIGTIANFNISGAVTYQNNPAPTNYVFAFDGYIQVNQTGRYRFFTTSDDGSRLYIDANNNGTFAASELLNNDGAQGETSVWLPSSSTSYFTLTAGTKYKIRVTYFQNGGGQALYVRYTYSLNGNPSNNPNNSVSIPDSWLYQTNITFTNYYSKATGDLHDINTWGTNPNGTGTAPPNFTNNYQVFHIANRPSEVILSTDWTVSGTSSRVVLGDDVTLTLEAPLTAKVYANALSTINLNHSTLPQLMQLDATSTVNMNVAGTVPTAIYGDLNLGTGAKTLPASSTLVMGSMQVADQVVLNGSTTPDLSVLSVAGDITFQGSPGTPATPAQQYSLTFTGNGSHTLNVNATDVALVNLDVEGELNLNTNDSNPHTLTVGMEDISGGLLLRDGALLNLGNNNLVVNGLYGINPNGATGEININNGDITVNTLSAQTSSLNFGEENHTIRNLTLSNNSTGQFNLSGQAELNNLLAVGSGTTVNMQGDFTLRSVADAAGGTARIGPLLNGAGVTGTIRMQRYMSGEGRIYRYISSPVAGVTAAELQAFFPITGNFDGASTGVGINSANASMFYFNETSDPQYQQFPSVGGDTQETLQQGVGYVPFIREGSAATLIEMVGEPHQGNIEFYTLTGGTGDEANGWNLLGNPYPAPIQWGGAGWTSSGVSTVAYIRENTSATTTGVRTFGVNWNGIIAPGQAFWVRTTTGSPSLMVSENAKTIVDGVFYREGEPTNQVKITMRNTTYEDATVIHFAESATASFDTKLDGVKLDNTYFNLSSLTADNKPMALNRTTPDYCTQEVKLRITNAAAGSYQLEVTGASSLISQDAVTFTDNFTQTEITVTDAITYPFSITADAASKADGRFTLRFRKPEVVLNQKLATEAACEQSSPIVLVNNSQPGVTYQAFHNGVAVSEGVMSTGGSLQVPVNPNLVGIGATEVSVKAGFAGCNSYDLPMTIVVQRDSMPTPEIITEPTKLVATIENATYQWYLNGELLPGQSHRELHYPESGEYMVEVSKATCLKVSEPVMYDIITSIETPNKLYKLYPNPTRDKFILTMEEPINFASMRITSVIGQAVPAKVYKVSEYTAEVDLTEAQTGLFVVLVNGQRYKIIKE